jgi:hypothetical protein
MGFLILRSSAAEEEEGGGASPQFSSNPWTEIEIDLTTSPFRDTGDPSVYDAKHVALAWHPVKERVYTWGGDYGNSVFSQPGGGATFTTNEPVGANTWNAVGGYRLDQFSIDPYTSDPNPWRLEQPFKIANNGGSPEQRPPINCQNSLVWDASRSKFWGIQTIIRGWGDAVEYRDDPWAAGTLAAEPLEPVGTWSWVPGASGSPGTWTLETTNALILDSSGAPATPTYDGGRLHFGEADERIAAFARSEDDDVLVAMSCNGGSHRLFIFYCDTLEWEWRTLPTDGLTIFNSSSQTAILGDYLYSVARVNLGGTRTSRLIRIHLTNALALANEGSLANNSTNFETYVLPWSISPDNVWEDGDLEHPDYGQAKWQEHVGVMSDGTNIYIAVSYDELLNVEYDGATPVTKHCVFSPATELFYQGDDAPEQVKGSAWCYLPDTNEALLIMASTGSEYPAEKAWRYRFSHLGPLSLDSFASDLGTDPITHTDSTTYWTSAAVTEDGKLMFIGAGTHIEPGVGGADNGVRLWDPVAGGNSTYLRASSDSVSDAWAHNNHMWFFSATRQWFIGPTTGVYDLTNEVWLSGTRTPLGGGSHPNITCGTGATAIIYMDASVPFDVENGDWDSINGSSAFYNAQQAWSDDHDCGVAISGGPGSFSGGAQEIHLFVPSHAGINATAVSQSNPYTCYRKALPATVGGVEAGKSRGRDGCCFVGDYVYWVGGGDAALGTGSSGHFFRMKITPHLTSKTESLSTGDGAIERLDDCPVSFSFGLLRFDPWTNALLLITDQDPPIWAFDLTYPDDVGWVDVSPAGYTTTHFEDHNLPFGCLGGYVDVSGSTTLRKFYWRPGHAEEGGGFDIWSRNDPVRWNKFMSLKLKRG